MDEFDKRREKMVAEQLIERGINDPKVIAAVRKVERHLFISEQNREKAYDDTPVQIDCSQTISQPYIVALMTQLLGLSGDKVALEIGTGTGYQTAILAEIAKFVYSIERHPSLAENAKIVLSDCGYSNIEVIIADGSLGLPEKAPFDGILVSAAAPSVPDEL
ncbi:methyltransferase domain-containing protein, partial [candidate division KSB1 bacterium]|nr:methyltransferase domain-containing protein [candidate division KSB1 bacterium]